MREEPPLTSKTRFGKIIGKLKAFVTGKTLLALEQKIDPSLLELLGDYGIQLQENHFYTFETGTDSGLSSTVVTQFRDGELYIIQFITSEGSVDTTIPGNNFYTLGASNENKEIELIKQYKSGNVRQKDGQLYPVTNIRISVLDDFIGDSGKDTFVTLNNLPSSRSALFFDNHIALFTDEDRRKWRKLLRAYNLEPNKIKEGDTLEFTTASGSKYIVVVEKGEFVIKSRTDENGKTSIYTNTATFHQVLKNGALSTLKTENGEFILGSTTSLRNIRRVKE